MSGRGVVEDLCFVRVKCDAHSSALGYRLHFKMCVALCICMGLHGASCYMRVGSLAAHIFSSALVHHVCSGSAAYRVSSSVMGRNGAVMVVLLGWDGMRKGRGKGRRGTGTRTMATGKRRGCGASGLYYSRVYSVSTVHSVVWALEHTNIFPAHTFSCIQDLPTKARVWWQPSMARHRLPESSVKNMPFMRQLPFCVYTKGPGAHRPSPSPRSSA